MTGETHVLESPPTDAAADWTIPQDWAHSTQEDHRTWDTLFARQARLLPGRASDAYLRERDVRQLAQPGIPDFQAFSKGLITLTGWHIASVPGLVHAALFFDHMAKRRFVAANIIRHTQPPPPMPA